MSSKERAFNVWKYVGILNGAYFGISIIVAVIATIAKYDGASMAPLIALVIGARLASQSFQKDFNRVPSKGEKSSLVWMSLISTTLISMLIIIVVLADSGYSFFDLFPGMDKSLMLIIMVGTLALEFALLHWTFG